MKIKLISAALLTSLLVACGGGETKPNNADSVPALTGDVKIDGSSTVYPITESVAEDFGAEYKDVHISVAESGTGGGFKKFGRGEVDINDASRPIKSTVDSLCKANNIKI